VYITIITIITMAAREGGKQASDFIVVSTLASPPLSRSDAMMYARVRTVLAQLHPSFLVKWRLNRMTHCRWGIYIWFYVQCSWKWSIEWCGI